MQYGGLPALRPLTPEDKDHIMAALKQSDRVISINLTVTTSLRDKLSTFKGVFPELQDLVLLCRDGVPLTMPNTFRWGQRLRRLHSTGVVFPALLQLLSYSTNLIDLQLHEVFFHWQFSPGMLMKALSKLGQLRSLSLRFRFTAFHQSFQPLYLESVFFPALKRLNYHGSMEYLEDIVARIDAPFLKDIEITFFDDLIVALSEFSKFIDWIELYRSHRGTHILSSQPTISMPLIQLRAPTLLKLQMVCKPPCFLTSSMAQICLDISPFLFNDEGDLRISTTRPSGRMDGSYGRELQELLNKFTGKVVSTRYELLDKRRAYFTTPREAA